MTKLQVFKVFHVLKVGTLHECECGLVELYVHME